MAAGAISVVGDNGQRVSLEAPAQRIVSLAPHLTELLFELGVGDRILGTSTYSRYPDAASSIPRIGSYNRLDKERILALRPDLVVGWPSGNGTDNLESLRRLGLTVFALELETLGALPDAVLRLGKLVGSERAGPAAAAFGRQLEQLGERYGQRLPLRVFVQIWRQPLMTIGSSQFLNDILQRCGGHNIFADQSSKTISIDHESVLARRPEVMIALQGGGEGKGPLAHWRAFPTIPAVANGHLYALEDGSLARPTLGIIKGAEMLCETLDRARSAP